MSMVMEGLPVSQFPADPANIKDYQVPPPTIVPVVVGLVQDNAETVLRTARLRVEVVEIPSLDPVGTVVSQSLEPGTSVSQGSLVTIHVSTGETPKGSLPNLVGLTFDEAVTLISEFELSTGLKINLFQQKINVNDPAQVDHVVSTNPPAGASLNTSATITVFVGQMGP
jgi:serine/threonine-protein kinase